MIVKKEKVYTSNDNFYRFVFRKTSWCLFGIIPLFVSHTLMEMDGI